MLTRVGKSIFWTCFDLVFFLIHLKFQWALLPPPPPLSQLKIERNHSILSLFGRQTEMRFYPINYSPHDPISSNPSIDRQSETKLMQSKFKEVLFCSRTFLNVEHWLKAKAAPNLVLLTQKQFVEIKNRKQWFNEEASAFHDLLNERN